MEHFRGEDSGAGLPGSRGVKFIAPQAGLAPQLARRLLKGKPAGGEVPTTLDGELQRLVVERLAVHLDPLRARNVGEGAVRVAANRTGEVLADASRTSAPERSRFVDGVAARRQAGSTLSRFFMPMPSSSGC